MSTAEDTDTTSLSPLPQEMQEALTKFDDTAKAIITPFLKRVESRETPRIIYHYTNDVGLRRILETGQIWLSHIFNLNDPSELSHVFSHAEKIKNEKESRFLQLHQADVPPPEVKRRYRSYELVKYREFDWKHTQPRALKQIVVGPAADFTKAKQFATDCLAAFGIEDVEIVCSTIPYRAL